MNPSRFRHIFLPGPTRTDRFTNPRRGGTNARPPPRDRIQHSDYLKSKFNQAWQAAGDRRAVAHATRDGVYIDFYGEPGYELPISSLEAQRLNIRLLAVRKQNDSGTAQTVATIYVPNEKRAYFLRKFTKYAEENSRGGKPKNYTLVNSISDIRLSVLESFWQDEMAALPDDTPKWVEVWLSSAGDAAIGRFQELLRTFQVQLKTGVLKFPERAVLMVQASRHQLYTLVESSDDIAELRLAKEVATHFTEMENAEQTEFLRELQGRIQFSDGFPVRVCILDGGVNNGHLLLAPVLAEDALHTVEPGWGTGDSRRDGHGTLMAGIAVYGDLVDILGTGIPVRVEHALESVKILPPPPGENPVELWGDYTARGIYGAEIQSPECKRIVCLAVTATDTRDRGRPSSWSGMVDEVASGYSDDRRRLFIVSAGNVESADQWRNYPEDNLTNEIHDPAQAWNCLTVGAYTNKVQLRGQGWSGWSPIAPAGGLSPHSTTSVPWPSGKWPIKPEVLFEGGNVAKGHNDSVMAADDLQLLSTWRDPQTAQFAPHGATSAASALAARMAAQIQVDYPQAWPETVRALIVHAAEWTETMKRQFLTTPETASKREYAQLLRICGYGVPSMDRARYCAANSLTLIAQAELQPYAKSGSRQVTRDMHLYNLPWPIEVLQGLGEVPVEMRVTLSYFVEPSPGQVGWDSRYRYASHALRFEVNGAGENEAEFVARINRQARDEQEGAPGTSGPSDKWTIGIARNVGSIHSDIWRGSAIDLAASNLVGIYPATGWWKERHHLGRLTRPCRYSLIVSIHAPQQGIDIYSPVSVQLAVPIEVPITVH